MQSHVNTRKMIIFLFSAFHHDDLQITNLTFNLFINYSFDPFIVTFNVSKFLFLPFCTIFSLDFVKIKIEKDRHWRLLP